MWIFVLQVGGQHFAAHRFVLFSRSEQFYRQVCHNENDAAASTTDDAIKVIPIAQVPAQVFQFILEFVYTGTGNLLEPGPCRLRLPPIASTICEETVSHQVDIRSPKSKADKQKNKKSASESADTLKFVHDCCLKLGLPSLAVLLEKVAFPKTSNCQYERSVNSIQCLRFENKD